MTNTCCSKDHNIDIYSVEAGNLKSAYNWQRQAREHSTTDSQANSAAIDIDQVLKMDPSDKPRKNVEKQIIKIQSLIRGHLSRCRYQKYLFLFRVIGKKPY